MKNLRIVLWLLVVVSAVGFMFVSKNSLGSKSSNVTSNTMNHSAMNHVITQTEPAQGVEFKFELTNQLNELVTASSIKPEYKLVYFGFTRCGGVCPATLGLMSQLMDYSLSKEFMAKVQPIFVSVDPTDTPAIMAQYLTQFSNQWLGLTGNEAALQEVIRNFKISVEAVTSEGQTFYQHPDLVFVFNGQNELVGSVSGSESSETILQQLESLVK